jgi:hypothetical protein
MKTLAYYSADTVYMHKWENINPIRYNDCEILLSEYYVNIMLNVLCQLVVALGKNRIFFSFEPKLDSVRRMEQGVRCDHKCLKMMSSRYGAPFLAHLFLTL